MTIADNQRPDAASEEWWRTAVVYQVYPRSFCDLNGDGVGDLAGVRSRLAHLQRLGVDVIWMSPIYQSPQADNGYDISDYQAIDPVFGSLDEFDALVRDIHARGMKLVMDLVVNHTSAEHPWFQESRSSLTNPKRDWYWWRPPRDGYRAGEAGAEPTNWESRFSGPTWTLDHNTGEYYLHLFDRSQPDLNWENVEVRKAIYAMMGWWLDRGIDGFRMDVINLISKDPRLPDGVPSRPGSLADGFPHYSCGPRVHEFLREMRREVFAKREGQFLTVGEMPGVTVEEAVLFTDPTRGELDMVFQFEHVALDHGPGGKFDPRLLDLRALKDSLAKWQSHLNGSGWNSLYWNNHDQPRAVSRFGDDRGFWRESATALGTVLHMHRGTPYIYQGEEIGMTNAPLDSIDELRDVEALNYYAEATAAGTNHAVVMAGLRAMSRDNARTPMQWDASEFAGFTSAGPWIDVNPNHVWLNADAQYEDPRSVFNHYRRLVEIRHTHRVVTDGDFRMLLEEDPYLYAFQRHWRASELTVVANMSSATRTSPHGAPWAGAPLLLSNYGPADRPPAGAEGLRPWEARIYLAS